MRVLIVEDDPLLARGIVAALVAAAMRLIVSTMAATVSP